MIEPYKGRVYDPCFGSGGMFVQSENFVEAHGGQRNDIAVYGEELNDTTWRLGKMNLAIRGIEADLGPRWGDTFHDDLHPDLKADFILANPPFNISDWGGDQLRDDPRWKYGVPPAGNANFAWLQHMASKLAPQGVAGVVLANGSLSSQQSGEGEIRQQDGRSRPRRVHRGLAGPALLHDADSRLLVVSQPRQDIGGSTRLAGSTRRGALHRRPQARATGRSHSPGTSPKRTWPGLQAPITRGVGNLDSASYEDIPGFCASATIEQNR